METVDARSNIQHGADATAAQTDVNQRMGKYWYWFPLAAIAGIVYLLYTYPDTITPEQAWLAAGVIILGLAPSFLYLSSSAQETLPLLPLHGLFYATSFGLPVFFTQLNWRMVHDDAITTALWLTILGLCALYTTYFLSGRLWFQRVKPIRLMIHIPLSQLQQFAWVFFIIHLAYQYIPQLRAVPSLGHIFYPLGWIAISILYILHLSGSLLRYQSVLLFFVALPLTFVSRFTSGALAQVMLLFLFMGLVYWHLKKRIPWLFIILLLGFFIVFQPVKSDYRALTWGASKADTGYMDKVLLFYDLFVEHHFSTTESIGQKEVVGKLINRLANISTFAQVVEMTPDIVPYWGGVTYKFLYVSFIPRIFWADKPAASFGNIFGHRYGLLGPTDYTTSFNLPWLIEFYANFGLGGVILGMALVGLGFRFIIAKLGDPSSGFITYVLGLTIVFRLFYAESNLAQMWGGLLVSFLVFYVILFLVSRQLRQ